MGSNNDPYTVTASGAALRQLTDLYDSSFSPGTVPQRDIVHMWTGKDFDGFTIGIAWGSGFDCPTQGFGYGISQNFPQVPQKFGLTAHEIGHNFGAGHTNDPSSCPVARARS